MTRRSILSRPLRRPAQPQPEPTPVDFDLNEVPARVLDPAPVVDWRASSWDLLNGVEVRDHSDSIPGELFERLFNAKR